MVNETVTPLKEDGVTLVAIGKCALDAATALEPMLGKYLKNGIVLDIRDSKEASFKKLEYLQGTHPMPSEANVAATKKILELLKNKTENDVVLFVISGGGSTLLSAPLEGITAADETALMKLLFKKGATIQEINAIRKHSSYARGGNLAKEAYPAKVISLIFSDVPGNDINVISSAPTVEDETSVKDAEKILKKYDCLKELNKDEYPLTETPKESKYFENVSNILLVSNETALNAMAEKAKEHSLEVEIRETALIGEARKVAANIAKEIRKADLGKVLLYGGETTVTIKGKGRGGRNQELTLAALKEVNGGEVIASIASDGRDNGEFAGAIADEFGRKKAEEKGLDIKAYLEENDATSFFEQSGDYILTGATGTNVSDITIALKVVSRNNGE